MDPGAPGVAEVAPASAYPYPTLTAGSDPDGLVLRTHWPSGTGEPELEIVMAEPLATFAGDLLRRVRRGEAFPFTECDLAAIGGIVRIRGRDRNLVYRLTSYDPVRDIFTGQWPD